MATTGKPQTSALLITFPPSSDCENARWLLRHYGIKHKEVRHAIPYVVLSMLWNHGHALPLFLGNNITINGLWPLIEHFDGLAPKSHKLIPEGQEEEASQLWTRYNVDMGTATVVWAYYHLLPHWKIMVSPLSIGSPCFERLTTKYLYPLPAGALWLILRLNRQKADAALATLRTVFAEVSQRLADGRAYLLGDHMSIADIAFAVSGAPLVLPLGYGGYPGKQGPLPSFDQAPAEFKTVVEEMLPTPAGQFILRMYREERYSIFNIG